MALNIDWGKVIDRLKPALVLATTILGALSVVSSLALPRMKPVAIVLSVFFTILGLALIAQLILHWNSLATTEQKHEFVRALVYGVFLFLLMVGGMFARYFWELLQTGKDFGDTDLRALLMPLLVSLMVFYPLWTIASGSPRNFFTIVAAFQNGFFWQTIFSSLKPFAH